MLPDKRCYDNRPLDIRAFIIHQPILCYLTDHNEDLDSKMFLFFHSQDKSFW